MTLGEEKMEVDTTTAIIGSKRKSDESGKPKLKKKKPFDATGKTPVQALHELYEGCEFAYEQVGEGRPPSFRVVSKVDGGEFEGTGQSKAQAKRDLAMKVLHKLQGINPLKQSELTYNNPKQLVVDGGRNGKVDISNNFELNFSSGLVGNLPTIDVEKARRTPVATLSRVWPQVELNWVDGGSSSRPDKRCKVEFEVINRKFFGEGRNKKTARLNLAKTVLLCLYNINDFEEVQQQSEEKEAAKKKKESPVSRRFPLTQLKDLIGSEELKVEVKKKEGETPATGEGEGDKFHAVIIVKGETYEGEGDTKNVAKLRAAKKALEVLKPKPAPVTSLTLNRWGVDVAVHPNKEFAKHFPDVKPIESETRAETTGKMTYHFEAKVERKSFKVSAPSKKKGKLRLILEIFKSMKRTMPTEWKGIELSKIMEDQPVQST